VGALQRREALGRGDPQGNENAAVGHAGRRCARASLFGDHIGGTLFGVIKWGIAYLKRF
jgi:hypothetical protein